MRSWKIVIGVMCAVAALHCAMPGHGTVVQGKKSDAVVKASAVAGKLDASGMQTVTVTLVVDKGWHIYANPVKDEALESIQTEVKINAKVKPAKVNVKYPAGKKYKTKIFDCMVYEGKVEIQATVQRAAGDISPLQIGVTFCACDDSTCLLPATVPFKLQ